MDDPASNAHASNKLLQLTLARRLGLLVPDTLVTRSSDEALAFWAKHQGHVVIKPLSVGYVETSTGVLEGQVFTSTVDSSHLRDSRRLALCPSLLQQQIPKGVDVRVTIVDQSMTAMYLREAEDRVQVDIRKADMTCLKYDPAHIPEETASRLLRMLKLLDLRFGAFDLIETVRGELFFLEVNPNGQWAWMDLLGVTDIARTFLASFGADG